MNKNIENWEQIYYQKKAGNYLMYPSEHLVSLFFQNKASINLGGSCLDFGFGSANNSEFLIQQMQDLYGIEISESSLQIAEQRLTKFSNFNKNNFRIAGDFEQRSFDLIVAWQVLYYNNKSNLISTIAKLHHYLKPNGIFIGTLITNNDIKVNHAKRLTEETYEIDYRIPHQEGCEVYSPKNKDDFLALFNAFDVIDVGHYERVSYQTGNATSEYYLVARKK